MNKDEKINYYSPIGTQDDFIIYMKIRFSLKIEIPEDSEFPIDLIIGFKKNYLKYIFRNDNVIVDNLDNNIFPALKIKGKKINWNSGSFEIWGGEVK